MCMLASGTSVASSRPRPDIRRRRHGCGRSCSTSADHPDRIFIAAAQKNAPVRTRCSANGIAGRLRQYRVLGGKNPAYGRDWRPRAQHWSMRSTALAEAALGAGHDGVSRREESPGVVLGVKVGRRASAAA